MIEFEYDPYNKLRHTSYWFEQDPVIEWPLSRNAEFEEAPRNYATKLAAAGVDLNAPQASIPSADDDEGDELFDFDAKPSKFYMTVETVGSMPPEEVVFQGITRLQEKLATILAELDRDTVGDDEMAAAGGVGTGGPGELRTALGMGYSTGGGGALDPTSGYAGAGYPTGPDPRNPYQTW